MTVGKLLDYTHEQIEEFNKCANDPIYFMCNYLQIVHLDTGVGLFDMYDCQKRIVETLHNERKTIIMAPRQIGKTTTVGGYCLWYALFNENKTIAILANKVDIAQEILKRCQDMYLNLPEWLRQGSVTWNKRGIELENGCRIIISATTSDAIRGKSINFLIIDEFASVPDNIADDFFTAVYPTISSSQKSKLVLISTPKGYNHFYRFWEGAEDKKNGFVRVEATIDEIPNRTEQWHKEQLETLGEIKYGQEVLCKFVGKSFTLVRMDILEQIKPIDPIVINDNNSLKIYREINPKGNYIICADVSNGLEKDYSAAIIIDISKLPYEVVAVYRVNDISPMIYPEVLKRLAIRWNNAYVLVEGNLSDVGWRLYQELEYENVITVSRTKRNTQETNAYSSRRLSYGVFVDKKVKREGCSSLKVLVEDGHLTINDDIILYELSTYVQHKDSYAAESGYTDDLIACLIMFAWLTGTQFLEEKMNDNLLRAKIKENMLERIESDTNFVIGFSGDSGETNDSSWLIN